MKREYWREKLNKTESELYGNMLSAFARGGERVPCGGLSSDAIQRAYVAVWHDHPELFRLPHDPSLTQTVGIFGRTTTLVIKKLFSEAQAKVMSRQIDDICDAVEKKAVGAKTDAEKARVVCEYLLDNTTYEINNAYNQNAATVLCDKRGQCSGIAKAAKLLLDRLGIEAIIVTGTATDAKTGGFGAHAWNIVKLDGEYCHMDVTFLIGSNMQKLKPYRFAYCCCSDAEISKDHAWERGSVPTCKGLSEAAGAVRGEEVVISSLYELRSKLKSAVYENKHCFCFESRIKLPAEKLLSSVQKCCSDVITSLGKGISMRIAVCGNDVTINW